MDDYDSGDDIFDDVVDAEKLVESPKRRLSLSARTEHAGPSKRIKVEGRPTNDAKLVAVARSLLRDKFKFDGFRHEQEKAITSILKGENVLVIFPTGAGKSLCYQIPGIAFEELDKDAGGRPQGAGITIVVSPLIALMKDQTDALKRRGIPAEYSDSSKTYEQNQQIEANLRAGRLRLLYCSPEKLNNEGFVEKMKHVPGGVRLVAVDEAHCISEWGHNFRPDYLKLARFADETKAERIICLTATAACRVADDICKAFSVKSSNCFRTSPYRPNLQLEAEATKDKQAKYPKLFKFLNDHPGSTLVYATLQKQVESLAADLREQGFDAEHFHGGMRTEDKTSVQERFMSSKIRIVVATIAFGMGIDKADIRNIVHWDLSSTLEEYSQQIGRAGRDGQPSHCMLYLCNDDFYIRENFARGDLPSRENLFGLLQEVFREETTISPDGQVVKLNLRGLGDTYDIRASPLNILMAALELKFGLLRAITPEYTRYQFEALGKYSHTTSEDESPESKAIAAHAKKAKKWYTVDTQALVRKTGLLRADVIRKLNDWHDRGIIMLKTSGFENRYRILKKLPRTHTEINKIADELYADMQRREEDALARTRQVADMITANKCFSLSLAEHFGMSLPEAKRECGHCTFCLTKKPVVLPSKPPPRVDIEGIKEVLKVCPVRDDPRFLTRVAFGITSPRVSKLRMNHSPVFMSLADHEFQSLLMEFTNACKEANNGQE